MDVKNNYASTYSAADEDFATPEGYLKLEGIPLGTYVIYEVEAPEGYKLKNQENYQKDNGAVLQDAVICKENDSIEIKIDTSNKDKTIEVLNRRGQITIYKKSDVGTTGAIPHLYGAGFKIRTSVGANTWLSGTKETGDSGTEHYKYDATYDEATTYYIKEEKIYKDDDTIKRGYDIKYGEFIQIQGLDIGTYHIYEVEPPKGYLLKHQDEIRSYVTYEEESYIIDTVTKYEESFNRIDTGTYLTIPDKEHNNKYSVATIQPNVQKVSITGYIWVDEQLGKNQDSNGVYDAPNGDYKGENKVKGVKVRLINKDTKEAVKTNSDGDDYVLTEEDGSYLFESLIRLSEINNYYIEFDYSELSQFKKTYEDKQYINYIPVKMDLTTGSGSKAIMDSVSLKDVELTGKAYTCKGKETAEINKYGIAKLGLWDETNLTYSNINLGLKKIPEPDFDITENIATVKITMKGFTYTYVYGGVGGENRIYAPTVTYQEKNDITAYKRSFYPSDIIYDKNNPKEELKAEVKYRIDIKNTENMNMELLYKEKTMYLKQLVNDFDADRYTLADSERERWTAGNVTTDSEGKKKQTATITSDYLNTICDKTLGITPNETKTAYINFSVKHDAILDILNHPKGIKEEFPTTATATAYHKYTRNDYAWDNNEIPEEQTHYSVDIIKDKKAPYLIFELGQDRIISGKVFEDSAKENDNGEKLGNGRNETTENNTKDVIVELIDTDNVEVIDLSKENVHVSNLYRVKINETVNEISEPAVVKTNEYGEYSLAGIVPGYYYLRFTYGDGSQKICDVHGNEIKTVVSKDYKSTIVTSEKAKAALKDKNSLTWYRSLEAENYSVAIDSIDIRKEINKANKNNVITDLTEINGEVVQSGENINTNEEQKAMYAGTAKMLLSYEVDGTEAKEIIVDNGEQTETINNEIKGINFGIIEQPVNKALIEKVITYVTLTNAQNNVVFDGNPETIDMQGVSDLDSKKNGGSTYVRAEVLEEIIYSSKLELVYEVKVKNLSDVNYYTEDYYLYGEKGNNLPPVIILKVTNVKDYLDESLKYLPEKSSQDKIDKTIGKETLDKNTLNSRNTQVLTLNNWKLISRNEEDSVTIVAERYLSRGDKDMEIVNEAEIIDIKRVDEDGNIDEEKLSLVPSEIHTNGRVKVVTSITPPTGKNKQMITYYVIAGVVTLILLSAGIIIIKKKTK